MKSNNEEGTDALGTKNEVEDCEWVDSAVLNLSAVFSLCHAHNYAQIEFEHKVQHNHVKEALATKLAASTATATATTTTITTESELGGFEVTKLAKPRACVLEDHCMDTLGLEVQLQSIQIY